jgi:IclR family acetate operon transcriptional repressor
MARATGDGGEERTGMADEPRERTGGVQSIARALAILDELAANDDGLSLTALSRAVGLPPSSAHRLLTTLQLRGFVRFEQPTMTWRVGVQAFVVGSAFARSREVTPIAMPFMRQLMEKAGETVNLYVPSNGLAVCIAQVQSRQMISAISRPGGGLPLHRSAAGQAFLAAMGDGDVEDALAGSGADGVGPTPTQLRKLRSELGRIRALGYAFDDERVAAGLRCVATSILDEHGLAHAALSIAGPTLRLTDKRLPRLAELVVATGKAVTKAFGGQVCAHAPARDRLSRARARIPDPIETTPRTRSATST